MSNYVRNFGAKNYYNQTTIPQLIANNMSGCFFSETRCILLCPSLRGLQQMMDTCCNVASLLSFVFNVKKILLHSFGSFYKKNVPPLFIGDNSILSCSTVKCLGVHLVSGSDIKFDLMRD